MSNGTCTSVLLCFKIFCVHMLNINNCDPYKHRSLRFSVDFMHDDYTWFSGNMA